MSHPSYTLVKQSKIPEINGIAYRYRHNKTGAEVLSIVNDDENKVFSVAFPTLPENANGVAHILEHSVLCGSRKYPVNEPFVELLKGSMYTFLNALTYPDKTVYPVASTNQQDFYNLVDVYLDAVFFPNISPEILKQEGWHYEMENAESPLSFKGVVFNEMKGAYSSPERAIYFGSRRSIFPDGLYAVDSGGDPKEITSLNYEYFKKFHETYYHPSNAFVYFYGDDAPDKRLEMLDEYLSQFEPQPVNREIPLQPRFESPRTEKLVYIAPQDTDISKKSIVTINWLLDETLVLTERLRFSLLDQVLIGNPASPLWKALIDSGLGDDLSGHGLSGSLREMYFTTGLRGIYPEDAEKVEKVIFDSLRQIVREGLSQNTIEAAMNTMEFRLRENNTGSTPRGLSLMSRILSPWIFGADPIEMLGFENVLSAVKADLAANPRMFEKMIQKYLIENTHRTRVLLVPDPQLADREAAEETAHLNKIAAALSDDNRNKIINETHLLRDMQNRQDSPEDLAKIPRLKLSDLKQKHTPLPIDILESGKQTMLYHNLFTSGILYFTVGFDLREIPERLLPYLPLFGRSMLEMGTKNEDFVTLSERIGRDTGGISQSPIAYTPKNSRETSAWLMFDGKTTAAQTGKLLDLLRDVLLLPNFDNRERFRQMALDARSGMESALTNSGHGTVMRRLSACFTQSGRFNEKIGGLSQLIFLRDLVTRIESDWDSVVADLRAFHDALINRDALICNATIDADHWREIEPQIRAFINDLPQKPVHREPWTTELLTGFEGLSIPAKINFVGKAANIFDSGYTFHGSALVANKLLRTGWLWNRVRVQGGAYGAMCQFNRRSGIITMLSYRDPNHLKTLEIFDQCSEFLRGARINTDELTKSIIGVIGDFDSYELPDEKGNTAMMRYLIGESDDDLQKLRDEILSTTPADFAAYAAALDYFRDNGIVAIAGNESSLQEINRQKPDYLNIINVL